MDERVKFKLTNYAAMILPDRVGYSLTLIVLTVITSIVMDVAKRVFGRDAGGL
jgi:hypothetical protein